MTDAGSNSRTAKSRGHKPRTKAAAPRAFSIDVTGEGLDQAITWTCLGAHDPVALATDVAGAIAASIDLPAAETSASLKLSDDNTVRRLNKQWRGIDKPTNVLSFPMQAPPGSRGKEPVEIGDIIIAQETLAREAAEMGISAHDHFRHLVLHGLLHLLGYDHENDEEAEVMEALETRILATLGVADPYAGSDPIGHEGGAPANGRSERLR